MGGKYNLLHLSRLNNSEYLLIQPVDFIVLLLVSPFNSVMGEVVHNTL